MGTEAACEGLAQSWKLAPQPAPRASSASTPGSVVPQTNASSMARPETPSTSAATPESLMPASCGTKLPRSIRCSSSSAIHAQS